MLRYVLRTAEAGLGIAIWIGVLEFGGTSPPFFLLTQIIVLALGVFLLATSFRLPLTTTRLPAMAPILLIALVLLEICPFPAKHTGSLAPYQTVSHLLLLVTYFTAFYIILVVCQDRNAQKRIVYSVVALGVFEAFYGLAQYLTGWQQIFGYVKKFYVEDATGTYINRNHFAGFLEMVLPLTVALALRSAGHLRRTAERSEAKTRTVLSAPELLPLAFLLFLTAVIFTALVFSRSRMGIISAFASLIAVLALAGSSSLSKRTRAVAGALFFLGLVGIVVWVGSDPVVMRFETLGREYSQTTENRVIIWRDTIQLIRQYPWFGTGLGTFAVAYTPVQTSFLNLLVDHAHSDYLEVVSNLGLPGGALVFGSIFWILARAIQRYRKAENRFDETVRLGCVGSIVAILVHSLADFNLYIPANALLFSVVLALASRKSGDSELATRQVVPSSGHLLREEPVVPGSPSSASFS